MQFCIMPPANGRLYYHLGAFNRLVLITCALRAQLTRPYWLRAAPYNIALDKLQYVPNASAQPH